MSNNESGIHQEQGRQHAPIVGAAATHVVVNDGGRLNGGRGSLNNVANQALHSQSNNQNNNEVIYPANGNSRTVEDTTTTTQPILPSQSTGRTQKRNRPQFSNRELVAPHTCWLHARFKQDYENKFGPDTYIELHGKIKQCPKKKNGDKYLIKWTLNNSIPIPNEWVVNTFSNDQNVKNSLQQFISIHNSRKRNDDDHNNADDADDNNIGANVDTSTNISQTAGLSLNNQNNNNNNNSNNNQAQHESRRTSPRQSGNRQTPTQRNTQIS